MYSINLNGYYNRLESGVQPSDYKQLLFRSGNILQSAEMNEISTVIKKDIEKLSSSFVPNGSFINGGYLSYSKVLVGHDVNGIELFDFNVVITDGVLFFDGNFSTVSGTSFNLYNTSMFDFNMEIGIDVQYSEVTSETDNSLTEPANNVRTYGKSGAGRLKIISSVGSGSPVLTSGSLLIGKIESGEITLGNIYVDKVISGIENVIAEYDIESKGNYLVDGFKVNYLSSDSNLGPFNILVEEGKVNVGGYKHSRDYGTQLKVPELLDFELKQSEPIVFSIDGEYLVNHSPIRKVFRISGEKNITLNIDHGSYLGAIDSLPSQYTPLIRINSITQGSTVYIEGVDFIQQGDSINWNTTSATSNEPIPFSSYTVNIDYRETQTFPNFVNSNGGISLDFKSIFLEGYIPGSVVSVDYDFVLERIDSLVMNNTGKFSFIKGMPRENQPIPPIYNNISYLEIASIKLSGDKEPLVINSPQRVFKMSDIEKMYSDIRDNEYNIGRLNLKLNLKEKSGQLKNSFVDTFQDERWRDLGLESAIGYDKAISSGGDLVLNIDWKTEPTYVNAPGYEIIPNNPNTIRLLTDNSSTSIFSQPHFTKTMKVTESFFSSVPDASIRISPKSYTWLNREVFVNLVNELQSSSVTRWVWGGVSKTNKEILSRNTSVVNSFSKDERAIIPRINLTIESDIGDFNSNEGVDVYFGSSLVKTSTTDLNGKLSDTFQIPANEISGSKLIEVNGVNSNVYGSTTFFAQPLTKTVTSTTNVVWRWRRTIRMSWFSTPFQSPVRPIVRNTPCIPLGKIARCAIFGRLDPLAQSFTIGNSDVVLDAISIWYAKLPTSVSFYDIVEITAGYPDNNKTLTSEIRKSNSLVLGKNDIVFREKVTLKAGKSYAFIVGCSDNNAEIEIATIGERTINTGIWLTSQADTSGVLFKSSNNQTWTAIQESDMRFEIKTTKYQSTSSYTFNSVNAVGASEIIVLSEFETGPNSNIEYVLSFPDSTTLQDMSIVPHKQYSLGEYYTGSVILNSILTSNSSSESPEMNLDAQIVLGKRSLSSQYTSIGFIFNPNDSIVEIFIDGIVGVSSDVLVEIQVLKNGVWVWEFATRSSINVIEGELKEMKYVFDILASSPDISQKTSRIRITLVTPDVTENIILQNLRLNTIK